MYVHVQRMSSHYFEVPGRIDHCLVCGKEAMPLSIRTIHSLLSGPGVHGIQAFFVRFVKPGFMFPGPSDEQSLFVCKKHLLLLVIHSKVVTHLLDGTQQNHS